METATDNFDIQQQRAGERLTAALKIAPKKSARIVALQAKAAEVAAAAAAAEAEAVQAYSALEDLLSRRVAALADAQVYRQLSAEAENAVETGRAAVAKFAACSRSNDGQGRESALRAFDSIARIRAVAPTLPPMVKEADAAVDALAQEIQALCTQHGIDLKAIAEQCATNGATENPPGRYTRLMPGFSALLK